MRLMMVAAVCPPSSEPANSQLRRLSTRGLILRSLALLLISTKGKIDVYEQSKPPIQRVGNCFRQVSIFWWHEVLIFIEPFFKHRKLWHGESLSQILSLYLGNVDCDALDIKQTFDDSHRKFGCDWVVRPSIFKVAMNVSPSMLQTLRHLRLSNCIYWCRLFAGHLCSSKELVVGKRECSVSE